MEEPSSISPEATPRSMRIFISSTFRDMQADRDELTKFIFPQLHRLCEKRGVTWGYVDLRWGITDEQEAEGKVLPICLENIHRCKPYFIGLLGERYGWIPDEIPPELIEIEPWLAEHLDHSVTELEILHGVLNNPEMAEHAFFYFRDPSSIISFPEEQQADFHERPTLEEIERYGLEEAERRAEERKQKLIALKDKIRGSGFPLRENYRDTRELGEWILDDLTAVIDRLFPEGSQPDPLEREATEHEAFADSRVGVYIGRQTYFDVLDTHARGDGPPLVILGESGSGKSALLANWARQYQTDHPTELLLMHFIGSSPASADWAAMLRRIMGEFKRRFDIPDDIPDQHDALRTAFANWLDMAAAKERVVLILDALNQLEDRDQTLDLIWLPPAIPANIRLIVSTLPGRSLDVLTQRGCPTLQIEPLEPEERRQLITEYLAESTKALSPVLVERIAVAPQAANPLFIRAMLDELMVFGIHEELDKRIDHYLAAGTVADLYTRILTRYEQDYERDRPGLVRDAMSLFWAARRGVSETELLDILGAGEQPMPHAHWASLYLVAESALVNRAGLINFSHDHLRQAVKEKYLETEEARCSAHLHLADYFEERDVGTRKLEELPWQLARAEAWERLDTLLCDLPFFDAINQTNEFEVKTYWAQVEANSRFRMVDGYQKVLESPEMYPDYVWNVSILLADSGNTQEALLLRDYLVVHFRQVGEGGKLAASIGMQANTLYQRGALDEALALHKEGERLCRDLDLAGGLAMSLVNQAVILYDRADLDGAFESYKGAERLFRELSLIEEDPVKLAYKRGLAKSLTGQANVVRARGDMKRAMVLHKESERLCRELGHKDELVVSLNSQGNTRFNSGDLEGAQALYAECEVFCRELGNKEFLAHSLCNQAKILFRQGDLDLALALYAKGEHLYRDIGHKAELSNSLQNQARIFADRGDAKRALACHQEAESLCRELGDKVGLQASLSNHAYILSTRGELAEALSHLRENEQLCRELGNQPELAKSLILRAAIVGLQMRQPRDAMPMAEEAYRLAMACGDQTLVRQVDSIRAELRKA